MELLVVGAWLATCALNNKNKTTVIKMRLGWGGPKYSRSTPEVLQKYSIEKTRLQSSKRDSDGYFKSDPKVVQKYSTE